MIYILNMSGEEFYQDAHEYFLLRSSDTEFVTECVRNEDTFTITTALPGEEEKALIEEMLGEVQQRRKRFPSQ